MRKNASNKQITPESKFIFKMGKEHDASLSPVAGCICTDIFTQHKSNPENYDLTFTINCSSKKLCSVFSYNVFKCHKVTK